MEEEKQMPVLTNNLEREFQRKNKNRKMTIFIIFVLSDNHPIKGPNTYTKETAPKIVPSTAGFFSLPTKNSTSFASMI